MASAGGVGGQLDTGDALDDDTSASYIGQGLISCLQLPQVQQRHAHLRSLCLHGNQINRIEGLQHLSNLTDLNLSSNAIMHIEGLAGLINLASLNLASNQLQSIEGLAGLSSLTHLNLSYNFLTSLSGLSVLQGPQYRLSVLNIKHNQLSSLQTFSVLVGCMHLRELLISGNPICQLPNHMQAIVSVLPQLAQLDQLSAADALATPYDMQAAQQFAAMRLQSYEPAPYPRPAPQAAGAYMLQQSAPAAPQPAAPAAVPLGGAPRQQAAVVPQGAAHGDAVAPLQQQQHMPVGTTQAANAPVGLPAAAASVPIPPPDLPQQPAARLPANWQPPNNRTQRGSADVGSADAFAPDLVQQPTSQAPAPPPAHGGNFGPAAQVSDLSATHDQHGPSPQRSALQAQPPQPQPTRIKVYVSDTAAQTSEYTPLAKRLHVEALELRQQLTKLTGELQRRNALEEELRQEMHDAIVAAEESAHKKVEEGFREASFAVSKALHELESARRAAYETQERLASCSRSEEEQRQRCLALEKDVTRLREEVERLHNQLQGQAHSSSSALEDTHKRAAAALQDERRRAEELERAAAASSQQAQALAAELSVAKAAASSAEQKVAALEAALQQSSSVTVNMTAKVAQTMADASAQIDVLKTRLSTTEQQVVDQQRREVDARAEINMLTSAMAAERQQHQREMEQQQKQHEEALRQALDRERLAAEERGKAAAQLAAQADKGVLQEQITYLKAQLQYALKECDAEVGRVQDALAMSQAEAGELRAALQAAALKQREAEALVTDFTSVVQQQKEALRGTQRDRDALVARLRACSPEAFDALAAENVALKRGMAERDLYKEQSDEGRRKWQDAEKRITELQVASMRQVDELQSKVRSLENALAAARSDVKHAEGQAERLRQDVEQQVDAVKIKAAMVDSANDTIASLKAEVADLQAELDDVRRQAEEAEAALAREHQDEDREKEQLRSDLEAAHSTTQQLRNSVAEGQAKLKEVEGRLRAAQEAVADKDRMIKYVEEEVDRVKELFEKREQRLRDERDAARRDAEASLAARDAAQARLGEALGHVDALARDVEVVRSQLAQAHQQLDAALSDLEAQRRAAAAAIEAAAAHAAEVGRLSGKLAEAEGEMRALLVAVEQQKASSASKMKQLASLLQEL